jgi:hypothetical protein
MTDFLLILQTVGICVGALALVVMAFFVSIAAISILPSREPDEFEPSETDDSHIAVLSPEEFEAAIALSHSRGRGRKRRR